MTRIKVCGITNLRDALMALELGVDAIGFVFAKSPRQIGPLEASKITRRLPPFITKVGVFVNEKESTIKKIAMDCLLDVLQFHADESPTYCKKFIKQWKLIKAFRIKEKNDLKKISKYETDAYLLDSFVEKIYGGTGMTFNWGLSLLAKKLGKPIILSGGLRPETVADAIRMVRPYAVDVSTGIESKPGKKSYKLMKNFIEKVRSADDITR
jgi:phosphoribosylanthranilate isomerase